LDALKQSLPKSIRTLSLFGPWAQPPHTQRDGLHKKLGYKFEAQKEVQFTCYNPKAIFALFFYLFIFLYAGAMFGKEVDGKK
jgi:hypothetical protein